MRRTRSLALGTALAAMVIGILAWFTSSAAATRSTLVSITIDDGTVADGLMQGPLDQRGIKATWYTNSGRLGSSGYMTVGQIQALAAAGHEIAGHTVDHPNLTALTVAQDRAEVCDDRRALQGMGLSITDFAYPFGAHNPAARQAVADCGYASGRGVGSVGCGAGCPVGESIPAPDPYVLRTPPGWTHSTSPSTEEQYVTNAERGGGGWVVLTFHGVCQTSPCNPNSIDPQDLATILDFLRIEATRGAIRLLTVAQVVALPAQP